MEDEIKEYISQLTATEKKALEIAKRDLESSFDIGKSIGFLAWKKAQEKKD